MTPRTPRPLGPGDLIGVTTPSTRSRIVLLVLLGAVASTASWLALDLMDQRSLRMAGEAVTAQLAGDLQAAFDPATLRPATNPTGAEYLVLRDGDVVSSSDLPLGTRPGDLVDDGTPVEVEGYALTTRDAADDDGVSHLIVAYVPTRGGPGAAQGVAILLPVLLVLAAAGRRSKAPVERVVGPVPDRTDPTGR